MRSLGSATLQWTAATVLHAGLLARSSSASHVPPPTLFSIVHPETGKLYTTHERRPQHEEWSEQLRAFWEDPSTEKEFFSQWDATEGEASVARSLRSSVAPSTTSTPVSSLISLELDKASITQHGESLTV